MKRVTITDISFEAGVSKATVSRVLNHPELVDEETRNHVQNVIKKNRYAPSVVARNLSNNQSNTIGVIIPEIDNPFYGKILRTIVSMADEHNLVPVCFDTGNNGEKDSKALKMLLEHRVCGVIYAPSVEYANKKAETSAKQAIKDLRVPVVLLDRKIESFGLSGVYYANVQSTYRATRILLAAGHTAIALIGGNPKIGIARERKQGYFQALREAGRIIDSNYIFEGDFTTKRAYQLAKQMLALPQRPTAVVTCNNWTALGFLQALTEANLQSPKDIEHIGIDEIDVLDSLHIPYNHAIRSTEQMGKSALRLLLEQMKNPDAQKQSIVIAPKYVLDEKLLAIALQHKIVMPREKGNGDFDE